MGPTGEVSGPIQAGLKDLPGIVALHRESLDYSLNSRLGAAHLTRAYEGMLEETGCLISFCNVDGQLAGVVSATLDPEALTTALRARLTLGQLMGVMVALGTHPNWWPLLWESMQLSAPVQWQGKQIQPCLTTIAVAPAYRRLGVGQRLIAAVDNFMRLAKQPAYRLDTLAKNTGAREFYKRSGFEEVEQRGTSVIFVRTL